MKTVIAFLSSLVLLFGVAPGFAQENSRPVITSSSGQQVVEKIRLGRGSAEHVVYSPDGGTLAVASSVGVWLYQASALATETEPPLISTPAAAEALAFSPDGATIAIASDSQIFLWDVASQQISHSFKIKADANAIAFSPDGSLLAINLGYNGISLWDLQANVEQTTLSGNLQRDAALVFSPDGQYLAGSTSDYAVHLWKIADASDTALTGHTRYVYDFAFSPDSALLASASYDKTVSLWDVASGANLAVLTGTDDQPLAETYAVAFSPDGSLLVSGHADGGIAVWDVASQALKTVIDAQTGDVLDVAFSPDGAQIATASTQPTVQLWDAATNVEIAAAVGHTAYMSTVSFSPDSVTLALTDWNKNIWLWDTAAMQQLNFVTPLNGIPSTGAENVTNAVFSPDGKLFAATDGFDVTLYDAVTHAEVRKLSDCIGTTQSFVFSPDSSLLALAASEGMCLFNLETGDLLVSLPTSDWSNSVAFSPDQTLIAVASKDQTTRVYGLP